MKLLSIILFTLFTFSHFTYAQQRTVSELLGYPADTKLLIIHADDMGVSHSSNAATIEAMESGMVNSASIMVPCPWFPEAAKYAANNRHLDFGIHLTLTSEWSQFRWGPVTPYNEVPGLVDEQHFFYPGWNGDMGDATAEEVEKELRAQIKRAIVWGIDITHLDTHMFALYLNSDYLHVYQKLGREYRVPVLLDRQWLDMRGLDPAEVTGKEDLVVDRLYMALPDQVENGLDEYYINVLQSLNHGLNVLLIHPAFDNDEMRAVTKGFADFGSAWRQKDFDFFTSERCRKIIQKNNIRLVTWREIKNAMYGK